MVAAATLLIAIHGPNAIAVATAAGNERAPNGPQPQPAYGTSATTRAGSTCCATTARRTNGSASRSTAAVSAAMPPETAGPSNATAHAHATNIARMHDGHAFPWEN